MNKGTSLVMKSVSIIMEKKKKNEYVNLKKSQDKLDMRDEL